MALLLIALLLALPFVELWAVVAVAGEIGLFWTLALLVGLSVAGAWLMKREGVAVWRRANAELAAGRMPAREVLDGALVLLGGALLVVPGFVTDAVGLLLLLPPVRAVLRPLLLGAMARRAARGTPSGVVFVRSTTFGASAGSPGRTTVVDTDGREAYAEVVDVTVDRPPELGR